jgi:hypothetical protein
MLKTTAKVFFLAAIFLFSGISYSLRAESVELMNQKMVLEAQMESRIKQILSSFLGTSQVIPVVRITLIEKGGTADKSQGTVRKWDESEDMVLPGVPAATSMTRKAKDEAPKKDESRLGVSRINISVIIGAKLSGAKMDKVKQIVSNTFALNPDAGDTLSVETFIAPGSNRYFGAINAGEIAALLGLGILGLFLFGPFKGFLRALNENLAKFGAKPEAAEADILEKEAEEIEEEDEKMAAAAPQSAASFGGGGLGGLFSHDDGLDLPKIINKDNIDDLRLVLSQETPEVIARIVQRLPADLAAAAIPPEKRAEVVAQFSTTAFEDPDKVKDMMKRVKTRVEWSFGGAIKLGKILQTMDRQSQETLLGNLRAKDPSFATRVEHRLFRFTDLLLYDDASLKRIFRKAGAEPFARCLKSCPEEATREFFRKLGPSIENLVANHLKTMLTAGRDSDAESKIMNAAGSLSSKGFIPSLEEIKQQQDQLPEQPPAPAPSPMPEPLSIPTPTPPQPSMPTLTPAPAPLPTPPQQPTITPAPAPTPTLPTMPSPMAPPVSPVPKPQA